MGKSKSQVQLCVYVDDGVAETVKVAAAAQKLTVSKFLSALIARDTGSKAVGPVPSDRALGYLSIGLDALLDQHDPKLRAAVRRVHEQRFGSAPDGH